MKFFDQSFTYPIDQRISASARFWMAEIAYHKNDYALAFQRYEQFLDEPGVFETEYHGAGYYGQGYCKFKEAGKELDPEVAKTRYLESLPYFKKFIETHGVKDPRKNYDAVLRVADVYFVNKQYENAIVYYDKVADDSQGNKDYAMYQKGLAYGYLGQPDKKTAGEILVNRGANYAILGNLDKALPDLNKGLEINPENLNGYANRAILYTQINRYDLSLKDRDAYIALNPDNPDIYYERGVCKINLGQTAASIADFNKAIVLNNTKPVYYLGRAQANKLLGNVQTISADISMAKQLGAQIPAELMQ
jgi:tetratricopeptide (TPR) repeat protein